MKNYEQFLAKKKELQQALQQAIQKTLVEMGPKAKGISWFSSSAK